MLRNSDGSTGSVLKSIGLLALAIEAMPLTDFIYLMVKLSNPNAKSIFGDEIIIGKND